MKMRVVNICFFDCPTAKFVWSLIAYSLGVDCRPNSWNQYWIWVQRALPQVPKFHTVGLAAVCWAIWRIRNNVCFEKKELNLLPSLCDVFLSDILGRIAQ
jgi:hypothetical protein